MTDQPETTKSRSTARPPHPQVLLARLNALGALVVGTAVLVEALAIRSVVGLLVVGVFALVAPLVWSIYERRRLRTPTDVSAADADFMLRKLGFAPRVPVIASIVAFVAYAAVLTVVHFRIERKQIHVSENATAKYEHAQRRVDKIINVELTLVDDISSDLDMAVPGPDRFDRQGGEAHDPSVV